MPDNELGSIFLELRKFTSSEREKNLIIKLMFFYKYN